MVTARVTGSGAAAPKKIPSPASRQSAAAFRITTAILERHRGIHVPPSSKTSATRPRLLSRRTSYPGQGIPPADSADIISMSRHRVPAYLYPPDQNKDHGNHQRGGNGPNIKDVDIG